MDYVSVIDVLSATASSACGHALLSSEVVRVSSTAHSLPRELSDSASPAAPGGTSGQYVEGSGQLLEE